MLEVLVSLVLIVSVGVTVVLWIQNGIDSVTRMKDLSDEVRASQMVIAWARTLNPAATPRGKAELSIYRLEWESTVVSRPIPQAGFPAGIGNHNVGLYEVSVSVFRKEEMNPWFARKIRLVGYVKVRESSVPWELQGF